MFYAIKVFQINWIANSFEEFEANKLVDEIINLAEANEMAVEEKLDTIIKFYGYFYYQL